ncbi:transcription factor, contains a PHD finger motif [Spiromyces aspiralis]|uniref:Transcription factor, contains a PHD finger motif n=1 Tax=Spiromyces aspiralis TaxID=68401 RepID=A0ACC1HL17_9FUNG|nr:transcription factor, contains a PHD finger motif [Spiromyces aspiralis]
MYERTSVAARYSLYSRVGDSTSSLKTVAYCIKSIVQIRDRILLGDDFFYFKCEKCADDNQEEFMRYHLSWVDVVHITLFNLTHNPQIQLPSDSGSSQFSSVERGPQTYEDGRTYFHYKADVARFIDKHWGYFWKKTRGETWINSASSALSTNSTENVPEEGRFESGKAKYNKNGMWALTDDLRLPSSYDSPQQQKVRQAMYTFSEDGRLVDIAPGQGGGAARKKRRGEGGTRSTTTYKRARPAQAAVSESTGGVTAAAQAQKARAKKRKSEPKSKWVIGMWPDIDNPPGPVKMCREQTHTSQLVQMDESQLVVWNDRGYRMAKATHGVETGTWYYEVKILDGLKPEANLRIGWSQISGERDAPCGFDYYSYSMRINPSRCFHVSYGFDYGEPIKPGDVLGILIHLPPLDPIEQRDIDERRWHPDEVYRAFKYTRPESERPPDAPPELPPLPILRGSEIEYFLNGRSLGTAFRDLYLGKYHPALSPYMGGRAELNFGPTFKYPPPEDWGGRGIRARAMSELEYEALPATSGPVISDISAGAGTGGEVAAAGMESEAAEAKSASDEAPAAGAKDEEGEPSLQGTTKLQSPTAIAVIASNAVDSAIGPTKKETASSKEDPAPSQVGQPLAVVDPVQGQAEGPGKDVAVSAATAAAGTPESNNGTGTAPVAPESSDISNHNGSTPRIE